jgi:hypothetical protein
LNTNVVTARRSNRGLPAFNGFLAIKSMRLFALRIAGSSEPAELLGVFDDVVPMARPMMPAPPRKFAAKPMQDHGVWSCKGTARVRFWRRTFGLARA